MGGVWGPHSLPVMLKARFSFSPTTTLNWRPLPAWGACPRHAYLGSPTSLQVPGHVRGGPASGASQEGWVMRRHIPAGFWQTRPRAMQASWAMLRVGQGYGAVGGSRPLGRLTH